LLVVHPAVANFDILKTGAAPFIVQLILLLRANS
jgi:hypothetical protein